MSLIAFLLGLAAQQYEAAQAARSGIALDARTDRKRVGAFLGAVGDYYFALNDGSDSVVPGMSSHRTLSGALTATALSTNVVAGLPVKSRKAGRRRANALNLAISNLYGIEWAFVKECSPA